MQRKTLWTVLVLAAALAAGYVWWSEDSGQPAWLAVVTYTAHTSGEVDGVALIDLNPASAGFGQIVQTLAIAPGVLPHHLYYNLDGTKLYATALGGETLYRVELDGARIARVRGLDAGGCQVGEDLYFSPDGARFDLTCMGSDRLVRFDAQSDQPVETIQASGAGAYVRHPHGVGVFPGIDRMIVTETISPALDNPGTSVTVIEYGTGKVLSTHVLPGVEGAPSAPVEVFFLPNRPLAYITTMLGGAIWSANWDEASKAFTFQQVDDGAARGHSWPLEMVLGPQDHLYVSWAQPGVVDVYSLQDPQQPHFLRTLPAGAGAHHMLFAPDGATLYVQNNLLNLDRMNAGTVSVVDLASGKTLATLDAFKKRNLQPTSMTWLKAK